jgi:copper(I)-binding protein
MKKILVIVLSLFVLMACQEKKETSEGVEQKAKTNQEVSMEAMEDGLQIMDAWVRPAAKNRNTGIFFRVVNNTNENDTLVSAVTNVAEKTEIHETFTKEGDMMGMREVEFLVMESGKVFQFKPMSYHVMLINLNEDLTVGKEVDLTLNFKKAGEVNVKAKVEDKMPSMKAAEEKDKMEM